jgi:excisionase family DNA binding protein
MSIAETADYLGMSPDTIADWVKSARLRGSRIGRFWRIRPRDVEAFLEDPPPLHPDTPPQRLYTRGDAPLRTVTVSERRFL